jgi:hypothetical protein
MGTAEFYADSVEKVAKKLRRKKLLTKKCQIMKFRLLFLRAISFWVRGLDSNSASNFAFCDTHIEFFCLYWHFLLTLKPNTDESAQKTKNIFYISAVHFRPGRLHFDKKKSKSLYPNAQCIFTIQSQSVISQDKGPGFFSSSGVQSCSPTYS